VVLNRVLPDYFADPAAAETAGHLEVEAAAIAGRLGDAAGSPALVTRVLREVGASFLNYRVVATREAEQRKEMAHVPDIVATVPFFESDIYDLSGLLRLGNAFWR
jgi:hypothetical protein